MTDRLNSIESMTSYDRACTFSRLAAILSLGRMPSTFQSRNGLIQLEFSPPVVGWSTVASGSWSRLNVAKASALSRAILGTADFLFGFHQHVVDVNLHGIAYLLSKIGRAHV